MLATVKVPLLQTKLSIPPSRSNLVARQRLTELLDVGLRRKLILISAPPGFGKTTLLSSWIHQADLMSEIEKEHQPSSPAISLSRVAWVSLDEQDNDPRRFWQYVIAALQSIDTVLGNDLPESFKTSQAPPVDAVLTVLINNLHAFQPDDSEHFPPVLILDDYHQITNDEIHQGLNFLIDHQPTTFHLILTTRSDPPLQLPLRQGRSEVTQIRATDLSFNRGEAEEFLNSLMGLDLSDPDITALEGRTEGWIAGLQLAALSLQDQADKHAFVTHFAGDDRYIADYLVDEVLRLQPPDIQSFLLQTSILDQLSAPLCDAVTGRDNSRLILARLEKANLFLTPLDNHREWYRYHPLFADLLRQRLEESAKKAEISKFHEKAGKWHLDRGEVIKALSHHLQAGEYQEVAELIEERADEIFAQFRLITLSKLIQVLPIEILDSRPILSAIYAWALLATSQFEEAEHSLRFLERSVNASTEAIGTDNWLDLDPEVRAALIEAIVIRSVLAVNRFDLDTALELSASVLPYLKEDDQPFNFNDQISLRTVAFFNMGIAYEFKGDGAEAEQALEEAVELSIKTRNINILPAALAHLAQLQVIGGQLHQAQQTYQRAIRMSSEYSEWPSPLSGTAEIGLGSLYYEWNDLDRAQRHLAAGMDLAKRWNHWEGLSAGYIGLANLNRARGDIASALALLNEASELLGQRGAVAFQPAVNASRVKLWITLDQLSDANAWLRESNLTYAGELEYLQEPNYLVAARLLIAEEGWEKAERLISRLQDAAVRGARYGRLIELLMLQALALGGQEKSDQAEGTLSEALALAEPEGYMRLFVDEGVGLAPLLYSIASGSEVASYAGRILNAIDFDVSVTDGAKDSDLQPDYGYVEPLSERETEVLMCVSEGLTNQEIALRLSISLSTVKSHTRNIYGKLGVSSRTQALARAKSLGILTNS